MTRPAGDTICAISTPLGTGAIGIVRLSGPRAVSIAEVVFRAADDAPVAGQASHTLKLGTVVDGDRILDEALLAVMRAPRSYTREDVVELHCHGGPAALRAVLELVVRSGARMAAPGEFTRRAFEAGRLDLTQAEAVLDLIQARTRAGLRAATARLSGRLGQHAGTVRDQLAEAAAELEASLDFPDEELPDLEARLRARVATARASIDELLASAPSGRLYREGLCVALAGKPNVGKSSLFNRLVREARAIVTPEPGTTRDVVEETIHIEGVPIRLLDAAGLREAQGEAERQGVERARRAMEAADLVLLVLDGSQALEDADRSAARQAVATGAELLAVLNKADLPPATPPAAVSELCPEVVQTSAETGQGIETLEAAVARRLLADGLVPPEEALVSSVREADCLRRAGEALERFQGGLAENAPLEATALDLKDALSALGELLGETSTDDLLDRIFSQFCIGK